MRISRVPVCLECLAAVRPIDSHTCERCGAELFGVGIGPICPVCTIEEPAYRRAAAYGRYDDVLRKLIHLLKYDRVRPVASVLGRLLSRVVPELFPQPWPERVLVSPVPLHPRRRWHRGFNQSELIARELVRRCDVPGIALAPRSLLVRKRFTESQTGLSRDQRLANLRGAFSVPHPIKVANRNILLVDDVLTTGTTVGECARTLQRAGAASIYVVTVARALHRDSLSLPIRVEGNNRDENLAMGGAAVRT